MARGADTDEYTDISYAKPGLKREFAFALKSSEENARSIGSTRIRRSRSGGMDSGVLKEHYKRIKVSGAVNVKDENVENDKLGKVREDDVEMTTCVTDEEPEGDLADLPGRKLVKRCKGKKRKGKSGVKISKEIEAKKPQPPTTLKHLLATGFLEGVPVSYKTKKGEAGDALEGIISNTGIVCFCNICYGMEVVSANDFEIHANSKNKRPADYIFLKNGKNLRYVLNACQNAPLESLESIIQSICSAPEETVFCHNCNSSFTGGGGEGKLLCRSCKSMKKRQPSSASKFDTKKSQLSPMTTLGTEESQLRPASVCVEKEPQPNPSSTLEKKKRSQKGSSSKTLNSNSACSSKRKGKLTKKDLGMHKLVFQDDILADGTELAYFIRGEKRLQGCKMGSGILCSCCNKEVSPSLFEAHAGCASRRKPYLNIYTSNGASLHELALTVSKNLRKLTEEEHDDLCSICTKGGDLVSCDNCPRAFHTGCAKLPCVPTGTWYCKYCKNMMEREKFVETNANAIAAGRIAGMDPLEEITIRCRRILGTLEADAGGCVLCRSHDFSNIGFGPQTVIICDQCEKEYHVGCLKTHEIDDLKELPAGKWFCGKNCSSIHSDLEELVAGGDICLPQSLRSIVKTKMELKGEGDADADADLDISWRLLSGRRVQEGVEEESEMLSEAVAIFHERFDPLADPNSGVSDLIPHMVFGRKLRHQDFGGMYCAVLKVNSNIVSAGIIRVFGEEVAELPLVATSTESQGQGYFQVLFSRMEDLLVSLGVKNLVLPAADDAEALWTNKFGFKKIPKEELVEYRKDYQMMVFQGTEMLQKSVSSGLSKF